MPPTIEPGTNSPNQSPEKSQGPEKSQAGRPATVYLSTDLLARPATVAREYFCTFIKAGRIRYADNTPGPFQIPPAAIQTALDGGMFKGISAFVDHASWFETPSLRNLAGRVTEAWWDDLEQAAAGTVRLFDTPAGNIVCRLFDQILADAHAGAAVPDLGLSLVFWPQWQDQDEEAPAGTPLTLAAFRHIESVDFVFQPAADGRVLEAMAALQALRPPELPHPTLSQGERARGSAHPTPTLTRPLPGGEGTGGERARGSAHPTPTLTRPLPGGEGTGGERARGSPDHPSPPLQPPRPGEAGDARGGGISADSSTESIPHSIRSENMPPKNDTDRVGAGSPRPPAEAPPRHLVDPSVAGGYRTDGESPTALAASGSSAWQTAMRRAAINAILSGSGLPARAQEWLRRQNFDSPEALEAAIEHEREHIAELRADGVVQIGEHPPRGAHITLGRTGIEQVQAAFEAFLEGTQPPSGVQPLTGLRELYHVLSGDYEMYGVFQPDRVYLANVNSSTMAALVANAMNKVVINAFQAYPQWWLPIVTIRDFPSLQDVRWITLGGIGELPTVAEGAAYTELTWDDQTETSTFVKKGGYLGLTIEAIDKDDTGQIRAAPRALAQAAWLTLSKSVSDIFTSNAGVGPTMSDSVALFHAGSHGNLLTTALSWSEWVVVRTAMMKQTELNSGERLGGLTAPRYLVVPIDLENVALQILASEGEPGTADNDINPFADGNTHNALLESARRRVIVVPLWTDTNNWAAVADPALYPSIGLAFRYGRTPEIFSVASPTAGLMFTNDTLPVKVRFFYAVGPTDYRGLHKSNVT